MEISCLGSDATEAVLKPSSEAPNSFWIKFTTEEDIGQFSTGPINKSWMGD